MCIPFSVVRSVAQSCLTLCNPMDCSFPIHHEILELTQISVHLVGDAIQPSHSLMGDPLLLLPSIFPSMGVFSSESVLCSRLPKYWSFSVSHSPSNEYSGLISFRMDWLHLLAVQGIPQFKSINSSVLSFLYSLTLTSIYDYWKNHSFDYMYLCWQSNLSAFYGQ